MNIDQDNKDVTPTAPKPSSTTPPSSSAAAEPALPLPAVTLKSNQNASTKVSGVVNKILIPLLQAPIGDSVSFDMDDACIFSSSAVAGGPSAQPAPGTSSILQHLQQSQPEILKDKRIFIEMMSDMYDTSCGGGGMEKNA